MVRFLTVFLLAMVALLFLAVFSWYGVAEGWFSEEDAYWFVGSAAIAFVVVTAIRLLARIAAAAEANSKK